MIRDVFMFILWFVFTTILLMILVVGAFELFNGAPSREDGAAIMVGTCCLWLLHNMTRIPLLMWRRRKHHLFRIVHFTKERESAVQIKLFGVWFYVSLDQGDLPVLAWSSDNVVRLPTFRGCSKYVNETAIESIVKRLVPKDDKKLTPPILFTEYKREKIE